MLLSTEFLLECILYISKDKSSVIPNDKDCVRSEAMYKEVAELKIASRLPAEAFINWWLTKTGINKEDLVHISRGGPLDISLSYTEEYLTLQKNVVARYLRRGVRKLSELDVVEITVGMEVKSLSTGNTGTVVGLLLESTGVVREDTVIIKWSTGNVSKAFHHQCTKVIVL